MEALHVVFGSGPLGRSTAGELARMGKRVRMINRSGKASGLPEGVEVVAGDAYDSARNIELTRGAAAIYQCAQPHYYEWAQKFPPLQEAILNAAAANGCRLVVGDNLYMYGAFEGTLREDSPVQPNTRKGRVRAEMAAQVMRAHQEGRVQAAVGRASDFFGPEDHGVTNYLFRPAVMGKAANLIGRTDQPHTYTYVVDFGRLLATLGTHPEALGQVWFTPSNPPLSQTELVRLLEQELGRPVRTMVAGPLMLRFLGLFDREIKETVEMSFEWMTPYVMDSHKAQQAFDLQPTPLAQAVHETVQWVRTSLQ